MDCTCYIDIHTHISGLKTPGCICIVNVDQIDASFQPTGLISVGIHPWNIGFSPDSDFHNLQSLANNPLLAAIGETGLDSHCDTGFSLQEEVFDWHISWSETIGKPLIIHCVRAYQQLLAHRKRVRATMPWIIHGYRSSPQMAKQLVSAGCFLSFGTSIFRDPKKLSTIADVIGLERIFFETDDSPVPIAKVYKEAARALELEEELLAEQIFANFKSIFQCC